MYSSLFFPLKKAGLRVLERKELGFFWGGGKGGWCFCWIGLAGMDLMGKLGMLEAKAPRGEESI